MQLVTEAVFFAGLGKAIVFKSLIAMHFYQLHVGYFFYLFQFLSKNKSCKQAGLGMAGTDSYSSLALGTAPKHA